MPALSKLNCWKHVRRRTYENSWHSYVLRNFYEKWNIVASHLYFNYTKINILFKTLSLCRIILILLLYNSPSGIVCLSKILGKTIIILVLELYQERQSNIRFFNGVVASITALYSRTLGFEYQKPKIQCLFWVF